MVPFLCLEPFHSFPCERQEVQEISPVHAQPIWPLSPQTRWPLPQPAWRVSLSHTQSLLPAESTWPTPRITQPLSLSHPSVCVLLGVSTVFPCYLLDFFNSPEVSTGAPGVRDSSCAPAMRTAAPGLPAPSKRCRGPTGTVTNGEWAASSSLCFHYPEGLQLSNPWVFIWD